MHTARRIRLQREASSDLFGSLDRAIVDQVTQAWSPIVAFFAAG
jgi:hypothetical protein